MSRPFWLPATHSISTGSSSSWNCTIDVFSLFLIAMASTLLAMASHLLPMTSNLLALLKT